MLFSCTTSQTAQHHFFRSCAAYNLTLSKVSEPAQDAQVKTRKLYKLLVPELVEGKTRPLKPLSLLNS